MCYLTEYSWLNQAPAIPTPDEHMSATTFIASIRGLNHADRENATLNAVLAGHVPSFMRTLVAVTATFRSQDGVGHVLTFRTFPNYMLVGTDDDNIAMPLWPITAQKLCDALECSLPTTRMVDLIYGAASTKLSPQPMGPPYDETMQSTDRITAHSARVAAQAAGVESFDRTKLVAGHKKDVVITNRLALQPDRVAIYGWHTLNGKPIQSLYLGHENTYCDYSHGIRLIANECKLDDELTTLQAIMTDKNLCSALSKEGVMKVLRQP